MSKIANLLSQRREDTPRCFNPLPHDIEVKALVRRMQIILRQEEPEHDRIQSGDLLNLGDDRHAAAFAQIERGPSPNFRDRLIRRAKCPREHRRLVRRGIRTVRRHHHVRIAFVLIHELDFHPGRSARPDRGHHQLLDFFGLLVRYEQNVQRGQRILDDAMRTYQNTATEAAVAALPQIREKLAARLVPGSQPPLP